MNEAVKYASTPYEKPVPKDQPKRWSIPPRVGKSSLDEMLQQTASEMTRQDANNIMSSSGVQKPNFASTMGNKMVRENNGPMPGIDISQLDFVSKAKSIYDAANKKTQFRTGQ